MAPAGGRAAACISTAQHIAVKWSCIAFGEAQEEEAAFRSHPPCRQTWRVWLLIAAVLGFAGWLSYDIASNDGFAPGIRDSRQITSVEAFSDDHVKAQEDKEATCLCPCTTQRDPTLQPSAVWDLRPFREGDLLLRKAWTCSNDTLPEEGSEPYMYLKLFTEAMFQRTLPSPSREFLLDDRQWAAARFEDVLAASNLHFTILTADLKRRVMMDAYGLSGDAAPLNTSVAGEIVGVLRRARAGVLAVHAAVLNVSAFNSVVYLREEKAAIDCSGGAAEQRTDFTLHEVCQPQSSVVVDCSDVEEYAHANMPAYEAYKRWCDPKQCSCIVKRTAYQKVVAVLAVFGGVYSACAISMWLLWLIVRVRLDGL